MLEANNEAGSTGKTYDVITTDGELMFPLLAPYGWHLLLFFVVAVPSLYFLVRLFAFKSGQSAPK
jgi:hypothetical protein